MEIKINSISLENFKGIKEKTINFNQGITNIFGENGSGKTSIFDAFTWLLFGKNSQGKTDFNVKTLKDDGTPYRRLTHSVSAELSIDGVKKSFKKQYKEKWIKKRGEDSPEFTGHETVLYIDDVPTNKKTYEQVISSLVDESLFRMITDPFYFASLKWKEKREIVLSIAGEPSNEEIAEKDERFLKLLKKLENRSFEEYSKLIAEKKKKIKESMREIPPRIDELQKSISDYDENEILADIGVINIDIENIKKEKDKKYASINEKSKHIEQYRQQLKDIRSKIDQVEASEKVKFNKKNEDKRLEIRSKINKLNKEIVSIEVEIDEQLHLKDRIDSLLTSKKELLAEYHNVNDGVFEMNEDDKVCSLCGQELPDIENNIEQAEAEFNQRKRKKLDEIKARGLNLKSEIETLTAKLQSLDELEKVKIELKQKKHDLEKSESEIINTPFDFSIPDDIEKKHEELVLKINELSSAPEVNVDYSDFDRKIKEKEDAKNELIGNLKLAREDEGIIKRIGELESDEKNLSRELSQYEKAEHLIMQFSKKKISMMDRKIKSKFGDVEFKMYNQLINGGEEETCEILIDGVPYVDANRSAQINTGIKIINTLCNHYTVNAPIFVDNAEAVTKLEESKSQIIRLIVGKTLNKNEINL